MSELANIYEHNDRQTEVQTVELPGAKVLHLSELLIGHKDADINFYKQVLDEAQALQPDAIVLSGLVQGDFKYIEKRRRTTLVPELANMDAQFRGAKEMIDLAVAAGVPVIYNLSNDDRRIAEEYTVETMRKLHEIEKAEGMPYWKVDQMRAQPSWNDHLKFQTEVAFPYCLSQGRRLLTAAENDGVDEYFELYSGKKPIPTPDFLVTHDLDLQLDNSSQMIRHNLNFSNLPMYQTHLQVPIDVVAQMKANGAPLPNLVITQHQQEAVGINVDDTWVVSLGGLIRAGRFMRSNSSVTDAPGDISRRQTASRRRISSPTATMHEIDADGTHKVTLFNEKLLEKADSPQRETLATGIDWQNGSPTARPDLQVKLMDWWFNRVLPERPMHLFFGGDIVQGRNYSDFANESESLGLISMEAQEKFVEEMILHALTSLDPVNADNLKRVGVIPGNHEWNSGTTKWHGYSFSSYLRRLFQDKTPAAVKQYSAMVTPEGEYLRTWTAKEQIGNYGVVVQHLPLERGAKGNSGIPIYQAHGYVKGAGQLMKDVDVLEFGHWHHPQYAMTGDKLAVISAAMAGLSGYEFMRGYRAMLGATLIHLGGGLPVEVEFVSKKALENHDIKDGYFSNTNLTAEGFHDDADFNPHRHGIWQPNFPKSGLQKAILQLRDQASRREHDIADFS
jgi:hypothetical protein